MGNFTNTYKKIVSLVMANLKALAIINFIIVGISLIYIISLPNIFKSTAILAPSQSNYSSNFSGVQKSLGGLAALVGSPGAAADVTPTSIALKTLDSFDFFAHLYNNDDFLYYLLAASEVSDQGIVQNVNSIYDKEKKIWLQKPSLSSAYKKFHGKHFTYFRDRKSGFIYLHMEHNSPYQAMILNKIIIQEINAYVVKQSTDESNKALGYIEEKISNTSSVDVRGVLGKLAERELQILMLSNATDEFAFKIIQSPFLPYERDRPRRTILLLNSILLSLLATIGYLFFILNNKRSSE
jgi:ACT domain-containing protein